MITGVVDTKMLDSSTRSDHALVVNCSMAPLYHDPCIGFLVRR